MNTESVPGTRLEEAVESFLGRFRAGERPAVSEYEAKYPELAAEIRDLFPALVAMEEGRKCVEKRTVAAGGQLSESEIPRQLGEYKLLRLIGRGGMGVVFEAWQESLGRHVALKILPFNSLVRPEHLERFRLEARAAARLHHTNIVPVFGVGEHEGVHYYAMQFIQGQPLDVILQEIRRLRDTGTAHLSPATDLANTVALQLLAEAPSPKDTAFELSSNSEAKSSLNRQQGVHYFAAVARIGLQAAEALDYAHGQGVLHRDVKPSNLLLDCESRVWIADFGLAKLEGSDVVTEPGALLGTLRYMAPERFHGLGDARSDVYALGVTLYELLTLKPVFECANRAVLSEQIAHVEPPAPRRLDPRISRDLETIVLKSIAKEPDRRYATAREMANDLTSFLEDRPIRARRITWAEKLWRWRRRNRMVANLAVLIATLVVVLAVGSGWAARDRSIRQTAMEKEIQSALKEADVYQEKDDLVRALAAARRAEALLGNGRVRPELREQVAHMMANLRFLTNVQEARLQQTSVKNNRYQMRAADPLYRAAFEDYGLPVLRVEPQEAADRIGRSAIARWLVSALDDWAYVTPDPAVAQKLRAVAKLADRDPVRQEVRDAIQAQRDSTLVSLAGSSEILNQSTITLFLLAQSLRSAHLDVAVQLLRRAQQRHPADFWINERLGSFLWLSKPPDLEESAGFHRVALALRSESPGAHVNLGVVLKDLRQLGAAKVELEEAIRLKPDYAGAHSILAAILHELGKVPESLAEYSEAIRFDPHDAIAHYNLGVLYLDQHQLNRAAAEFAEAIRLNSNSSEAHLGLGDVFSAQGKYVDAIKEYRTAKRSDPDNAEVYNNFGAALRATGEFREAEVVLRRAIQLKPDNASAHYNLGIVLGDLHRLPEAVAAYRQAIHLQADHAEFYINLGTALDDLRQWQEAEEVLTEAVCLGPHDPTAHYNLANVLRELGKLPGAAWEYREAIQLKPEHVLAHYNLGQVLLAQRKLPEAQAAYSKVIRLQPGHALAHNGLGNALYRQRMFFEAEQEYRAALRIQADLVPAQINLGGILLLRGKLDDAAEAYRAALTIEPANIDARCNLGAVLFQQGKHAEAATAIREAIRLQPNSSLAHASLAAVLVHTGQWREAVDAVDRLSQLDSGNEWNWYQSATLHMQIGDVEGYRRACREMLKRFGNTEKPDSEVRITMACLLAPEAVGDFKAVLKLVDRAGQRADKNEPNRRILLAKGLAEYRAGRVTESIGWLTRTSPKSDGASVDATAFAVLALAHHRLGHFTQARAALACAHAILAARLPNPAKGRYFGGDWQDWLHSQILCRETEAAIGTDGTRTKDKNSAGRHRK